MKLYVTELPDGSLVRWKPLTWAEFRKVSNEFNNIPPQQLNSGAAWLFFEAVAALSILDIEQGGVQITYDDLYAGTVFIIGQQVLQETGFLNDPTIIRKHKAEGRTKVIGNWYEEIKSYIMHIFRVTPDEMDNWTLDTFMEYTARAEIIAGKEFPVLSAEDIMAAQKGNRNSPKMIQGPDGRMIPVITKDMMKDDTPINIQEEVSAYNQAMNMPPNSDDFTGLGPRRKKIHPLRQRMMREGMI